MWQSFYLVVDFEVGFKIRNIHLMLEISNKNEEFVEIHQKMRLRSEVKTLPHESS